MLTTKTKPGRAPLGQLSKPWDAYDIEEKNDPIYRPPREKKKPKEQNLGPHGFPMCRKGLHEMVPNNTYIWNEKIHNKRTIKACKRCHSQRMAEAYQRRKAKQPKLFKEVELGPNEYPLCSKKLHEMSPHNLYLWRDKRTGRVKKTCKPCHSLKQRERYQEQKAAKSDSN